MEYGGNLEACKITSTMHMLYFKCFPGNSVVNLSTKINVRELQCHFTKLPEGGQFHKKVYDY